MSEAERPVGVIVGPTAAGKSAIALRLAQELRRSIISADSRQTYRHFNIGTAKPSRAELASVPHYGVDILDATERYSAHAFAMDATKWIAESRANSREPLIVGGTGFYIRALVEPLAAAPAVDADRRRALEAWFTGQDTETLRRWCERLDKSRAGLGRTQLLRALETALLSGTRLGDTHTALREGGVPSDAKPLAVRYLVVDPATALGGRIETRVRAMVAEGWPEEVRQLMERVPADAPGWLASGYGVMRQFVQGAISEEAAIERVVIETRQYAKRQRTWFRHQLDEQLVTRISSEDPHAIDQARAWLQALENHAP